MFSLLVSRHFAKRGEIDTSLPTYVLPILPLLLLFHRLAAMYSTEGKEGLDGRLDALERQRLVQHRTERRKIEKSFLASNPMSCNIDGVHGRLGELSSSWPAAMR